MKAYFAYKFTKHKNKENLVETLEKLSSLIRPWGIDSFILGRDVKKWKNVHFNSVKLIPIIIKNMKKCDFLLIYVDSNVFSKGLLFEIIISKILGKKSFALIKKGFNCKYLRFLFNKSHDVNDIEEITKDLLK